LHILRGHIQGVNSALFSADGKRIVTASDDETARVWDAESGEEILTLAGHKGAVLLAVFSPDGQRVATGSADGTARIWPLDPLPLALSRKPRELTREEKERFGIGLSPTPRSLVARKPPAHTARCTCGSRTPESGSSGESRRSRTLFYAQLSLTRPSKASREVPPIVTPQSRDS
jgi:WD40 repeat protein